MTECKFRSGCALSSTLDLIGDKWSLLILRCMFVGWTRYKEFLSAPEGISTNILAERLRRLEACGLITRSTGRGSEGPTYHLTRPGADLLPAMQALATWGYEHIGDRWAPPGWFLQAKPEDFYPPEGR